MPPKGIHYSLRLTFDCRDAVLVLGVGLQHEISHAFLCRGISDGTQQRKAAAIAIDRRTGAPGT